MMVKRHKIPNCIQTRSVENTFFNYASIATTNIPSWRSNADQWNLDYIYLNTDRNHADTFYKDISFVERAPSMLKRYQAMPYNQYRVDPTNEIRTSFKNLLKSSCLIFVFFVPLWLTKLL